MTSLTHPSVGMTLVNPMYFLLVQMGRVHSPPTKPTSSELQGAASLGATAGRLLELLEASPELPEAGGAFWFVWCWAAFVFCFFFFLSFFLCLFCFLFFNLPPS